ncbi:MAG: glycosyltransferase [Sphingobacteriales bacterium]|nr:glycosyltransferase [Sphingobacteriales bacterium]
MAKAINSVISQKIVPDFEICIGEDNSIDNTRIICQEYAKNYSEKIRLFLHERKNVIYINGSPTGRYNFIHNIKNAKGNYIALLDGDDYWLDPFKLTKQINFLEEHPEYVICCHRAKVVTGETEHLSSVLPDKFNQDRDFSHKDILTQNLFPTGSIVFRRELLRTIPNWFYFSPFGDWSLQLYLSQFGKIRYLSDIMSVYRRHDGGIHSGLIKTVEGTERLLNLHILFYNILSKNLELGDFKSNKSNYYSQIYQTAIKSLIKLGAIDKAMYFNEELFKEIGFYQNQVQNNYSDIFSAVNSRKLGHK